MIVGIGTDLCDITRVAQSLERFGERFVRRCFTEVERRRSDARAGRAASYAKRFAAKEACAKALGTGIRDGVAWRDMGVVNLPSGKPTMALTGGAARRLAALMPPGHEPLIHLAITDEHPLAQAFVVIEAVPIAAAAALHQGPKSRRRRSYTRQGARVRTRFRRARVPAKAETKRE